MLLAESVIKVEEGWRPKPYHCSEGFVTLGYGRVLSPIKNAPLPNIVANLAEELTFLRTRINQIIQQLSQSKPLAWSKCNEPRKAILVSMTYQLGFNGVLAFKKMWAAIEAGDFEEASKQMLDSKWAKQTRNRALRHAKTIKDGTLDNYYKATGVV